MSNDYSRKLTLDMVTKVVAPAPMTNRITARQADVIGRVLGLSGRYESFENIARSEGVTPLTVRRVFKNGMATLRRVYPDIAMSMKAYEPLEEA